MSTATKPKHIGRNISRIRELRGMKQEALAAAIGVSQQSVSNIEGSEIVDEEKLNAIAEALGVTSEAIKNYSDETVFNIIGNTYHDNASSLNYNCSFNPIDKIVQLYDEKIALYERMLKEKDEMMQKLEKINQ
ncbi:helix-turn-helix domain-containing protein [Flavobacterium salmonis]|uniref:Transcriptional regulator n=1 Tax=Flavobacterium salmonis TaxID=2654844 RepID=A0A6V6YQN2_9FLAO|nr:helix-turn-helix transcriptional regulator [Flavobacterium salmonis]CAD0001624.1 transcriptional regulator [Flavobacterium salmonis]